VPVIDVRHVSKRFYLKYNREFMASGLLRSVLRMKRSEELWALRDITFSVDRGESVAIIGANGSGKTTLLSIISGVTEPTTGEVTTTGRVAALLQLGAGFHPDLTGRENIYINAGVLGLRRRQIDAVYHDIAEFSELGEFLNAPIRRYSSGMLSRLGFSIAVHVSPDILIVDEVLGVGDQQFQKKCRERIHSFIEQGVTILFVSHSPPQVRQLCSRAVYLEEGRLATLGPVDEVLQAYTDRSELKAARLNEEKARQVKKGVTTVSPAAPEQTVVSTETAARGPTAYKAAEFDEEEGAPSRLRPIKYAPSARMAPRRNGLPATSYFYRNGPQLDLLVDEVLPAMANELGKGDAPLFVRYWYASIGCEPYSLALAYREKQPRPYRLRIEARDADAELVQAAIRAEYNELELLYNGMGSLPNEVMATWFTRNGDGNLELADEVRSSVIFGLADLLRDELEPADVNVAQNVLLHMKPGDAGQALDRLVRLTRPGGLVVVGGAPYELLVEASARYGLEPVTERLESIHDGWKLRRSRPDSPFGLPPIDRTREAWQTGYCSLFRMPATPNADIADTTDVARQPTLATDA
jgi:ABC-type polysaccharide/polyol phosphate transport system ATPase subunit/chemotaxis methyl-accepting protein methylase